MDHVDPSELISAYLDGEVTPPERADAERLLESSPELRVQLDDFARLSDLIRGLPREDAPPELAASIRERAVQKALLAPEAAVPNRSWRRELFALLGGAAVTVAGMAVIAPMLQHDRTISTDIQRMTAAAKRAGESNADMAEPVAETSLAMKETESLGYRTKQNVVSDTASRREPAVEKAPPAAPPPLTARKSVPAEESKDRQHAFGAAGASPAAVRLDDIDGVTVDTAQVQVGDMVEIASRLNDDVLVVVLWVVDVEEVGGKLEVLLSDSGLQVIPKDGESPDTKGLDGKIKLEKRAAVAKKPGAPDSQHLTLVYVDAPRETIAQVLDEMSQQHLFTRATLKPPVPASSIASVEEINGDGEEIEQQLALKNLEQAEEVGRNYAVQNVPEAQTLLSEPAADQRSGRRPGVSNFLRTRQIEQQQLSKTAGSDAKNDALATSQSQLLSRSQTNNSAVVLDLDTQTGLVANNRVARQALSSAKSQQAAKKGPADEEAKPAAESRDGDKSRDRDSSLAEEMPAPKSVRVLLVLQQAAAAP